MYFHVCETQRTHMHVTDTTATPNGHQMAVVTWDRSIELKGPFDNKSKWVQAMTWHQTSNKPLLSVPNYYQSVSPKQTNLEEDLELFLNFSSILCLWFEIQGSRTDNFFYWVLKTALPKNNADQNLWSPFMTYSITRPQRVNILFGARASPTMVNDLGTLSNENE